MARKDPYQNFRFVLEVGGIKHGFREATIADSNVEVTEYRNGDESPMVRKIPGLVKYGNLTLKSGVTDNLDLYDWHKAIVEGDIANNRKDVAVILQDAAGVDAARWEFRDAWLSKYDAPDLNATSNDVAIETIEIIHEGMTRTK